jgi:hypothetical protein
MAIKQRTLTEIEKAVIEKPARSRTAAAREVERARMILLASKGKRGSGNHFGHLLGIVRCGATRARSFNPLSPSLLNRLSQVRTVAALSSNSSAMAST